MDFLFKFAAKHWQILAGLAAVAAVALFFQIQLWVAEGKLKDVAAQRDVAVVERQQWQDSHVKLQASLSQLEADKASLQENIAILKRVEEFARKASSQNSAETAMVNGILRQLEETKDDPEASLRIRSRSIDWMRERTQERAAP